MFRQVFEQRWHPRLQNRFTDALNRGTGAMGTRKLERFTGSPPFEPANPPTRQGALPHWVPPTATALETIHFGRGTRGADCGVSTSVSAPLVPLPMDRFQTLCLHWML